MTGNSGALGVDPMLTEAVNQILGDLATSEAVREAEAGEGFAGPLWAALAEAGLTGVGIDEEAGGSGGTFADAAELVLHAARYAAPVPLAETVLVAGPALAAAGLAVPEGILTAVPEAGALRATQDGDAWIVTGTAAYVPYARVAGHVVALAATSDGAAGAPGGAASAPAGADGAAGGLVVVVLPAGGLTVTPGTNFAAEPRDTVTADGVRASAAAPAPDGWDAHGWRLRGALARSVQIAGALERVLEMAVTHAKTRVQFGRPIVRFQAVGQLIAQLGEQVAAARMAAETGVLSMAAGRPREDVPIAKIITAEAATKGSSIAHQVHAAMGMTKEHDLQLFTRRLWSWREECGGETVWATEFGSLVAEAGPGELWPLISAAR